MTYSTKGSPLDEDERAELQQRISRFGEFIVARDVGISRTGLARAAAGMPLYQATASAVRRYLTSAR